MKTILFLTDTHGNIKAINKLKDKMAEADYIFFAGDNFKDLDAFISEFGQKIYRVRGNCDFFSEEATEIELTVERAKILLTHGHKFGVKHNLLRLEYYAKEREASAVLYGHTHIACVQGLNGLLMVNAGNMTGHGKKTYAIITVNGQDVSAKIEELI